jgi:tetratricopeptide (TPR) repeat protein
MSSSNNKADERWQALLDAQVQGDFLTVEEAQFLEQHRAQSQEVAAEQRLLADLKAISRRTPQAIRSDDLLIANVLAAFDANPTLTQADNGTQEGVSVATAIESGNVVSWRSRLAWAGVGASLSAAAAAALFMLSPTKPSENSEQVLVAAKVQEPAPAQSSPAAVAAEKGSPAPKVEDLALVMVSGTAEQGGKVFRASGQKARPNAELAAKDNLCVSAKAQGQICLQKGSRARVLKSGIELLSGSARFDSATYEGAAGRPSTEVQSFGMVVAGVHLVAKSGVYEVVSRTDAAVDIKVESGAVAIDDGDGRVIASLGAGEEVRLKGRGNPRVAGDAHDHAEVPAIDAVTRDPKVHVAGADAKDLIAQARTLTGEGRYELAAAAYEKAIRLDKQTALARASMVSLGQLYGQRLKSPANALKAFDAYLQSGGGPLAEEAHLGKIEALGDLGRDKNRREAMSAFLRAFPSSSYADKIRAQLE